LASHPQSSPLYGKVRRARLPRFPYSLLYSTRGEAIRILGLMHDRRGPRPRHFFH
jgi:hypothetical protein